MLKEYKENEKKLNEERDLIVGEVTTNLPVDEKEKMFEKYKLESSMTWKEFYNNINNMLQETYNNSSTAINTTSPRNKTTSLKEKKPLMDAIRKFFFNNEGKLIVERESGYLEKIGLGENVNLEESDQCLQIIFERRPSPTNCIVKDVENILSQHGVLDIQNEELVD